MGMSLVGCVFIGGSGGGWRWIWGHRLILLREVASRASTWAILLTGPGLSRPSGKGNGDFQSVSILFLSEVVSLCPIIALASLNKRDNGPPGRAVDQICRI